MPAPLQNRILSEKELARLQSLCPFESYALQQGYSRIAGIDEAGRGPLAGPVVAVCCHFPSGIWIPGVNDSKKISPAKRIDIYQTLKNDSRIKYSVGISTHEEIDQVNIYNATLLAMQRAVDTLTPSPDYLLVDGMAFNNTKIPFEKIIKGDQKSYSIALASIIAKVTRDRIMEDFHQQWPHYSFHLHKGYGTKKHLQAIQEFGPCPIHRKTYEPIKSLSSDWN